MTIQEMAVDRVVGCYESDDDEFQFDPTIIITIIMALLQMCPKPPAKLRANARMGGIFVRAQVASAVHREAPQLRGKAKRAMVDALLSAAVTATNEEIEKLQVG